MAPKSATAATSACGSTVESVSLRLVCRNRIGSVIHQRASAAGWAMAITEARTAAVSTNAESPARIRAIKKPAGEHLRSHRAEVPVVKVAAALVEWTIVETFSDGKYAFYNSRPG